MRRSPSCITSLCALILCAFSTVYSGDTLLYSAPLVQLPVGARALGMGDCAVAVAADAFSIHDNPAAAALVSSHEIGIEGASLYGNISQHASAALVASMENTFNFGALYSVFLSGDIPRFPSLDPGERSDGMAHGYFRDTHHYGLITLAQAYEIPVYRISRIEQLPLPLEIAAGCNIKSYYHSINFSNTQHAGAYVNCDLGALLRVALDYDFKSRTIKRQVHLGFSIKDALPTKMTWLNSPFQYEEPIYHTELYGISYQDKSGFLHADWLVCGAIRRSLREKISRTHTSSDSTTAFLPSYFTGIEARYFDALSLRGGYSAQNFTVGAGLEYRSIRIDYAFIFSAPSASPARISCIVRF